MHLITLIPSYYGPLQRITNLFENNNFTPYHQESLNERSHLPQLRYCLIATRRRVLLQYSRSLYTRYDHLIPFLLSI